MIEFQNVTKVYESKEKKVTAVDKVNLQVEDGQICVFLGPSGCGKTTLLRMVNRLIPITSGTIEVNKKNVNSMNLIDLRRSIGYVIQQNGLFPNMTIEENICVVPKLLGWDRVKMKKRTEELLDLFGLSPDQFRKRFPYELSGGQQQRVGIARALAADPPIMLMDEPFGALDPIIREHIQNEFLKIQEDVKKTILFVSHDIDEAIRLANKIVIFKDGQLMQADSPEELLVNPKNEFVREFVGTDRTLKRLTLITVKDLLHKIHSSSKSTLIELDEKTPSIRIEDNLRTALSTVLASPNGTVKVTDSQNKIIGTLRIGDFEELTNVQPPEISAVY
jgi:osmoprotectant transport system ATP-binding protein